MNFEEIQEKREELARGPIYAIPDKTIENYSVELEKRTPKSKAIFDRAVQCIPGGVQHMLSIKNPYPLTIKNALGVKAWDVDGNRYLDYLMMAGPIILGHNYPPLMKEIINVLNDEGIGSGWTSEWEVKASELITSHMKNVGMVRFFQSGTEADMAAVRLARAYTGKKKIIRVGGSYHGWADEFVYDMQIPYSGPFQAQGIPPEHYSSVLSVGPNDFDALEQAFVFGEEKEGVAAVILEPPGGETGALPIHQDFNRRCRELCDKHGSLLIMDEVVTAFRFAMGGAQEFYGIDGDLTVLGKVLTHGFPSSGALGGKKEIMETLAGLNPEKPKPFVAGTMAGNALTTAATYWTLTFIEKEKAIERATAAAEKLSSGLNSLFSDKKLPFFSYNIASIVHYETAAPLTIDIRKEGAVVNALARKKAVDDFAKVLLTEGIITKYGARAFTSMAHTDDDIKKTLAVFEKTIDLMKEKK